MGKRGGARKVQFTYVAGTRTGPYKRLVKGKGGKPRRVR